MRGAQAFALFPLCLMSSLQALVLLSQLPQVAAQKMIQRVDFRVALLTLLASTQRMWRVSLRLRTSFCIVWMACLCGDCDEFGAVLFCQHIICLGLGGEGLFCCTPPGLVVLPLLLVPQRPLLVLLRLCYSSLLAFGERLHSATSRQGILGDVHTFRIGNDCSAAHT